MPEPAVLSDPVAMPPALNNQDRDCLREREEIISAGVRASIAAARALHEIRTYRDGILWRGEFASFADYCRARWDYGKAHSYRLADCGELILELEGQFPKGDWMPRTEGQVRPLLAVPKESRVGVWRAVVASGTDGKRLTAREVAQRIRAHAKEHKIILLGRQGRRRHPARAALKRMRLVTEDHPKAKRITSLLDRIEALLA